MDADSWSVVVSGVSALAAVGAAYWARQASERTARAAEQSNEVARQSIAVTRETAAEVERGLRFRDAMRQLESELPYVRAIGNAAIGELLRSRKLNGDERSYFRRTSLAATASRAAYALSQQQGQQTEQGTEQ